MIQAIRGTALKTESTYLVCTRCGIDLSQYALDHPNPETMGLCRDCRPVRTRLRSGHCNPWMGEVDDDFNPIRNGKLYLPGKRTCGHKDCVKRSHIEVEEKFNPAPLEVLLAEVPATPKPKTPSKKPSKASRKPEKTSDIVIPAVKDEKPYNEQLEAERFDRSYVTGEKQTWDEFLQEVERERYRV